jgi:hypothetical protein
MKRTVKVVKAVLLAGIGLAFAGGIISCATPGSQTKEALPEPQKTGFLGEYAENLAPGPEGGAKLRWLKPGVDFAKYNKLMLESVIFFFDDDSEYKGMDAHELRELADGFNRELVNTLNPHYPIVADPGPDVLRVRFAITDLKQSKPGLSAVSSVVPVGLGVSVIKRGATGSWTGSGSTSAAVMALDSSTDEVIGVAHDDRSAAFTERFTKWGSAEEAFKFWSERLKLFLDNARGAKQ